MPETIKGLIERVTYHNPQNGFAVLKVVESSNRQGSPWNPFPIAGPPLCHGTYSSWQSCWRTDFVVWLLHIEWTS